jgi:hypothetical protein
MKQIHLHNYEVFLLDYSEGNLNAEEIVALKTFVHNHPELEIDLSDFDLPYLTAGSEVADFQSSLKRTEEALADEDLLNYLEGNLSATENHSFEVKLLANPNLSQDLEDYKKTLLAANTNEVYSHKSELKKSEDDLILTNPSILYLEKQFSASEQLNFEDELKSNSDLQKEFDLVSKTILTVDESIVYPDKENLKKENKVFVLFSLRTIGSMAAAILLLIGFVFVFKFYNTQKSNEVQISVLEPKDSSTQSTDRTQESIARVMMEPQQELPSIEAHSFHKEKAIKQINKAIAKTIVEEKAPLEKEIPHMIAEKKIIEMDDIETKNIIEKPIEKNQTPLLASNTNTTQTLTKQNYLLLAEDIIEEADLSSDEDSKKGFWKRAVHLAKQVNKLGVKSIDGEEDSKNRFRLSFNSFSVEKK